MNVHSITFVSSKGWFDNNGFHPHTDDSLYSIIFMCKDVIRSYLIAWSEMANISTEKYSSEIAKFDGEVDFKKIQYLNGYRACVDDMYSRIEHLQKILRLAENAVNYF